MKKKALIITVIVLGVIGVILFGAGWYFSSVLMYPPKTHCDKKHLVYCGDPSEFGLGFTEVTLKTVDGFTIHGWYVPVKNSRKGIVLAHGRGSDRREGMRWVKALNRAGFNLLLFDFRNAGESDKSFNSMGFHEKKDLLAAVDYMERVQHLSSIGIFGASQGAACGINAMADDTRIKAGVFEASFANVIDVTAEVGKMDFGLPKYPLIPIVFFLFELRGDVDVDKVHPENAIERISPRPLLLIHCRGDNYTAYTHAERLFARAKEPKQLWTSPCTQHAEFWQSDIRKAEKLVTEFYIKSM